MEKIISQKELQAHLHYDKDTGIFTWIKPTSNRVKLGSVAGCLDKDGSRFVIRINKELYLLHRLAWLYVYGDFPINVIDHINGNSKDNRIDNLRACSQSENAWNSRKHKDNTSGHKGISYDKSRNKWAVRIMTNGKLKCIGRFFSIDGAVIAMKLERAKLHGEFFKA
jgi:hypothetical protein